MADHSQHPQPVLAPGWQRGCGLTIMMCGIALTTLSGLCTMGMTIADLSDSGHHGGDVNLSGIQYIFGAPFVVIGALIWWGGWALRRRHPGAAVPAGRPPDDSDHGTPATSA
jgi:hypothetical protein